MRSAAFSISHIGVEVAPQMPMLSLESAGMEGSISKEVTKWVLGLLFLQI